MALPAKKPTPAPTPVAEPKPRLSLVHFWPGRKAAQSQASQTQLTVVETPEPENQLLAWAMTALEDSRANTFLCDPDWTILYANKKSFEILEIMEPNLHKWSDDWKSFRAAEVVGTSLDFLFTDEPLEFRKASDTRNHPYRGIIKTGPCVCDVQVTSITDEQGELVGYAVDWERITDKIAQEKRIHSLMQTLEASESNTFQCDLNWNVLYANKKAYEIMEFMEPNLHRHDPRWHSFRAKEVVGKSLDWLFTDEPEQFRKASDPRNHPYHGIIKTGPCVCDVTVTSVKDEKGEPTGYAVYWERITDKVAMEKRQLQLTQALDGANTNIMMVDLDFKLTYMNQNSRRTLKEVEPELRKAYGSSFNADDLLGRCIDDFHKNPSYQRGLLKNESVFPIKSNIKIGPLTLALTVSAVKDKDGKVISYCAEWEDISARLAAEEEQRRQVEEGKYLAAKIEEMIAVSQAIAAGDLTKNIPVEKDDGIGKLATAFNEMVSRLSELVAQVRAATENIQCASAEIATGTEDLSQRTEEQASSLEETASSMEEMTATVKQNADNAKQANQLAAQARTVAENGGQVVSSAVASMQEINQASRRIADIISVIDEIAFQTNLLALNAAVEAARVGEQGRGFAVVAAEVRNLAGRSATAAKEIKALVQDSVQKVQEGSSLVNQSGEQLGEIVNSVKKVADIISEISAASQEQSAGIEQVNKAIMQMDQITQQNAALVEETATSSQVMSQQATDLGGVVGQFQVDSSYLAAIQQQLAAARPAASARPPARPSAPAQRKARPAPGSRQETPTPQKRDQDDQFEEF